MRRRFARTAGPLVAVVAVAMLAGACGGSSDTPSASPDTTSARGSTPTTVKEAALRGTLTAPGATFPTGSYAVAIRRPETAHPGTAERRGGVPPPPISTLDSPL